MKKIILLLLANTIAHAIPNNPDFARRFGSNSHIFNTPLYFAKGRCRHEGKQRPRICNYRKKVRREIVKESSR